MSQPITSGVPSVRQGNMHPFLENNSNYEKCANKDTKPSSDESKDLSACYFSKLPDEIILKILKKLDVISLSRLSRVNKRFNNLSRDSLLYKYLNLWYIRFSNLDWILDIDVDQLLDYFAPRCKHLQQLDLSICKFSPSKFREFLKTCCMHLTHLILIDCDHVDSVLQDISEICKNLKELNLQGCDDITNENISYLKNLQFLESLNIAGLTAIKANTLCEILQKNRQIRNLNLCHTMSLNIDAVAIELKNSCPNLERLDLTYCEFTSQVIDALTHCKNLKEVCFNRCRLTDTGTNGNIFRELFSSCQYLEKIGLSGLKLTKSDYETLTLCKNLKFLSLVSVYSATPDICSQLFVKCPKLEKLDLGFSEDISKDLIDQWNKICKIYKRV